MFDELSYTVFEDTEYLTREFTYTDKFGQEHCYVIADEKLEKVLLTPSGNLRNDIATTIDTSIFCYVPIKVLLIKDGQKLAQWLNTNITEMEI